MKLLLFYLALSSSVIVGSLGNIVDILASIEVPEADITTLIPNPTEQFRGYKILNEIDGVIYIGGREILIMYDAAAAKPIRNLTFPAYEDPSEIVTCEGLIGEENSEKICQHYIRLAEYVNDDRLLVCGTNKQTPHCDLVNAVTYKKISNFTAARKTQRSVTQNTTASYYGGYLYVGFSENTQPNPAHISKFTVDLDDLIEIAETDDQNENFVNEPHFVGKPYVKGNYMYFFYRETAVEAVNQGKFVYSRVARICLNDSGFNGNFEIFVKARLNCSLQGDYPFYFNHIQDVIFEEEGGDTIFYAVFTTTPHGPSSSAVCAYKLSDINKVFEESKFKGKESSGKLPGPVDRPAYANKFTECERLNNDERNFLKRNPLMDDLVPNWNQNRDGRGSDGPLFYSTSVNFYSIAVDNSTEGKIFYVGTEHGTILKAYYDSNKYVFFEQQIWDAKSAVTGLRFDSVNQTLLIVTGEGLFRMNLEACNAYCEEECNKFYHPYCTFAEGSCRAIRSTETTSVNNGNVRDNRVNILSLPHGNTITSCNSRNVELTCVVKSSTLCGSASLIWRLKKDGRYLTLVSCTGGDKCVGETSEVGHIVEFREIVRKPHYKMIHLSVDVHQTKTVGNFSCLYVEEDIEKTVQIQYDESEGCLTENLYQKREKHRKKLETEKTMLTQCSESKTQMVSSADVLFKACSECPGNPEINPDAL